MFKRCDYLKLVFIVLAFLPIFTMAGSGEGTRGGGDVLRFVFEEGRNRSVAISKTVRVEHWDWWGNEGIQDQSMRDWFFKNQTRYTAELESLTIEYRKDNPNGFCAQTDLVEKAVVYLSIEKCRGYTEFQAAQQLFVEAAHHFGFADREGDILAINLMQIYKQYLIFKGPLWTVGWFGTPGHVIGVSPTGEVRSQGIFSSLCFDGSCYKIDWNQSNSPKKANDIRVKGSATITGESLMGRQLTFSCAAELRLEYLGSELYRVSVRVCEWPSVDHIEQGASVPATQTLIDQVVRKTSW